MGSFGSDHERPLLQRSDNAIYLDLALQRDRHPCRVVKLSNGIDAILVSDPKMQASSATLLVNTGWLDDPTDCNGLAHLAEHCVAHCIFHNAVNQSDHSDETFAQYVSKHGGTKSAFTTPDYTTYTFAIAPAAFKYALKSFASAFTGPPLLTYQIVGHEVLTVDAELQKNKRLNIECIRHLNTYLTSPELREYRRLEGGNYASLTAHAEGQRKVVCPANPHDPDDAPVWESVRSRVMDWWEAYYPTRRKYVALCGPETIEFLTEQAIEVFSSLPSPPPNNSTNTGQFRSPWTDNYKNVVIFCATPQIIRTVDLCWVIPWSGSAQDETAMSVLRYIICDSGAGSLFTQLHGRRWLQAISVYSNPGDIQNGYRYVFIRITLTELGWRNWRSVVHLVRLYLELLRTRPPNEDLMDDVRQVQQNRDLWKQCNPDDLSKILVEKLRYTYPQDALLTNHFLHTAASFHCWLTSCIDPQETRILLSGPFGWTEAGVPEEGWETLPTLGIRYRVARLAEYQAALDCNGAEYVEMHGLVLPERNPFVPYALTVYNTADMEDMQEYFVVRPESLLEYRQEVDLKDPRAFVIVALDSPLLYNANDQLSFQIYGQVIMERLKCILNRATIADTWSNLWVGTERIILQVKGYPEYLVKLLKIMWDAFFDIAVVMEPWEFNETRDQMLHRLESDMRAPFGGLGLGFGKESRAELRSLLSKRCFSLQTTVTAIRDITATSVQRSMELLARGCYSIRMGLTGNINASIIRSVTALCLEGAKAPLECEGWLDLPRANIILDVTTPQPISVPNQIYYFCRLLKDESDDLDLLGRLIGYFASDALYTDLQTRYDIGHSFSATIHNGGGYLWLIIEGRTPRDPAYAERCIDRFLETLLQSLENTPADDFTEMLRDLDQTGGDECQLSFDEHSEAMRDFILYHTDTALNEEEDAERKPIASASLKDILDLFRSAVSPQSAARRKISMRLYNSPKYMSIPAVRKVLDELSSRGISIASDLENRLLTHLPMIMNSLIEMLQGVIGNQMACGDVKHVVHLSAERYPLEDGEKGSASEELASVPAAPPIFVESIDELRAEITRMNRAQEGRRHTEVSCHYRL